MAIANALQLEAARAMPALSRFNYDAMPSSMSPNLSICLFMMKSHKSTQKNTKKNLKRQMNKELVYYSVFAADTSLYDVTLTSDAVTLIFDLCH